MMNDNPQQDKGFSDLGIAPKLMAILEGLKFTVPTPIQRQAIPVALSGKDIVGIAQTGTGKTLAFAVPMLQRMASLKQGGLIIVPTRELAAQVEEQVRLLGRPLGLRLALLIGGASMSWQVQDLRRNPHVIIGTPGRIIDHLEQGNLRLDKVGVLVLDEADRMLDMGFAPQIKRVLERVPQERQTMLFSATMPAAIAALGAKYMKQPVRIEAAQSGTVAEKVKQELFVVHKEQKNRLLDALLGTNPGTVLVFSRTKFGAKRICRAVRDMGHSAAEIHSNLSLSQRRRSLAGFKTGTYRVLVATDIAARGIDVTNISLVINYDLPDSLDDYIHRVGRTGRAGREGQAISFVTPDQQGKIRIIERMVRKPLRVCPLPALPPARAQEQTPYRQAGRLPARGQQRPVFAKKQYGRRPVRGRKQVRVHM